jgi:hypothetical protein
MVGDDSFGFEKKKPTLEDWVKIYRSSKDDLKKKAAKEIIKLSPSYDLCTEIIKDSDNCIDNTWSLREKYSKRRFEMAVTLDQWKQVYNDAYIPGRLKKKALEQILFLTKSR